VCMSRSLLYHYFPTKRDLYVAIFKRASNRILARANPDPQLPLAEQLANGLEAHIQYFADHPFEAITLKCGALSDDPTGLTGQPVAPAASTSPASSGN